MTAKQPYGEDTIVLLARISGAVAARDRASLDASLRQASEDRLGAEVDEVLLQSVLFVGYPIAMEAMGRWRRLHPDYGASLSTEGPADSDWSERGLLVCAEVYGDQIDPLRENISSLHPDLERWMIQEGYGRVLGRPGLDLTTRELAIVAQLAVLGTIPQLYSHLRGAVRTGASEATIQRVLNEVREWLSPAMRVAVEDAWEQVRARHTFG